METLVTWISDLLWPRRCVYCGAYGIDLCAGCGRSFIAQPLVRLVHGISLASAGTMNDPALARAIWHLKYRGRTGLADPLAAWLAHSIRQVHTIGPHPLLVPIPLHPHRLSERGYNQAELIAHALGHIWTIPVAANALIRQRNTGSQVERATRSERILNMRSAFMLRDIEAVRNHSIILVDDVSTTGATLLAAAAAFPARTPVNAVVIARG